MKKGSKKYSREVGIWNNIKVYEKDCVASVNPPIDYFPHDVPLKPIRHVEVAIRKANLEAIIWFLKEVAHMGCRSLETGAIGLLELLGERRGGEFDA